MPTISPDINGLPYPLTKKIDNHTYDKSNKVNKNQGYNINSINRANKTFNTSNISDSRKFIDPKFSNILKDASLNQLPVTINSTNVKISDGPVKDLHTNFSNLSLNNLEEDNNNATLKSDGTKLAELNKLKEYAIKMERYMQVRMWQGAYEMSKIHSDNSSANIIYGSKFIEEMVTQAYGSEGGPLAEAFFENFKVRKMSR